MRLRRFLLVLLLTGCSPVKQVPVEAEAQALVTAGSPGAVVYVAEGGRVWQAAAGQAEPGVPMRTDHRFRIASITKTFTATLLAERIRAGQLSLSDRVDRLLPGVTTSTATVGDLARHTSGIADYMRSTEFVRTMSTGGNHLKEWTPEQLLAFAGEPGRPGGAFAYSNTNYLLLGMILEKLARKPYREQIAQFGLPDTELPVALLPDRLAHGTHLDGSDGTTDASASLYFSAGGLVSTVADVAAFYRALPPLDYGIFTEKLSCGIEVRSHSGMLLGYSGIALVTPDRRRVVVVQLNSSHAGSAIAAGHRLMCAL
ncbi:serine hydrolase domain-containing protein [Nonomuraea sp. NPDC050663]|uniref:serine hydrolase domain-containing protein n=1 Tax=Nonomuraea sp. NPDC050663 TaxID=3364370 RepID=UPI0037A92409